MSHAGTALVLGLAIGAASFITSRTRISQAPRLWLADRTSPFGIWCYELAKCPLCTATWMALAAAGIYRPLLVRVWWPLDYLTTALAITTTAMLAVLIIRKALEP